MRLIVVWVLFLCFGVVEARGLRSVTDRLPQIAKRIGIGKFVGVTALGTVLLCSPSCEHGERMVGEQFTRSGSPADAGNTRRTYHGENLAYSLGSIIGNQKTGTIRDTHHTGIYLKLGVWSDALSITIERERDGEILSKRFSLTYAGAASSGSFDIYDNQGSNDIGDGYFYTNGRTSYNFDAGDGVEVSLLLNEGSNREARIQLLRFYASKEVLDGQDFRGQPVYRNERFSWLELPANHFLSIGTNAQLERDAAELAN